MMMLQSTPPLVSLIAVLLLVLSSSCSGETDASLKGSLKDEWTTPKKQGDPVPTHVDFVTRVRTSNDMYSEHQFDWKLQTSGDLFVGDDNNKNRRVVLFALPGAFTPTCSSLHLPDYQDNYDEILQLGIDEVYCLSVNDAFVMHAWGEAQHLTIDDKIGSMGFAKVKLLPDGAAEFTRGMGMSTLWDTERGFGERSWRYSMVVNNGIIEKLFMEEPKEQNSLADPYEVSDADTMLTYLKSSSNSSIKEEL